jgi:hypothetical protein
MLHVCFGGQPPPQFQVQSKATLKGCHSDSRLVICSCPRPATSFPPSKANQPLLDLQEIQKAEDLVKRAGEFLVQTQVPKLVARIQALDVLPLDGQTLTASMHAFGINIRYLGKVSRLER